MWENANKKVEIKRRGKEGRPERGGARGW